MNYSSTLNSSILYYPSIEFPDDGFVKSSLCIWDTIYRIVPESYSPNDSDEIVIAVQEGAIKNIKLTENDLSMASDRFMDFITSSLFLPTGLEGYDSYLHKGKVDPSLYPFLRELSKQVTGDWITLSDQMVQGYMFFLANSISKNRNIPKISDNPDIFSIMAYFENDGQFNERVLRGNADEYYSTVIVPTLIPAGVERVDIDKVLKFRENTMSERAEFRNTVSGFTNELKNIKDRDYAQDITNNFIQQLESSKQSIFEKGKSFAQKLIPSFLAVGLPTAISTLALLGVNSEPYSAEVIRNTICISSVAALADGYNKSKTWESETASYYFGLKGMFEDGYGRFKMPKLERINKEFIND